VTRMDQITDVLDRFERADMRYRFVIDMASHEASAGCDSIGNEENDDGSQ
jgi:hypothetical protein